MSRTVPWSIKDVSFDARQLARDAAQRSGVTVGDWLDALIADHASDTLMAPAKGGAVKAVAGTAANAMTGQATKVAEQYEPSYDMLATGTDGPLRRFAVGERQVVHVFETHPETDTVPGAPIESPTSVVAAAPRRGVPEIPEGERMKEKMIRDAVAAITRRQAVLEEGLPPRNTLPLIADLSSESVSLGEIGSAISALETRLALSRASRAQAAEGAAIGSCATSAQVGFDEEASRAFDTLGRDLRRAVQDIDQRVRPNAAARSDIGAAPPVRVDELALGTQDLMASTARLSPPAVPTASLSGASADSLGPDTLMSDVRALLERLGPGSRIETLDLRMQDLAGKMERHLEVPSVGMIEDLGRRIDALQSSVQGPGITSPMFEQLLRGIEDKVGKARADSADIEHLEKMMNNLADRMEGAHHQPDVKALATLEAQIARLGDRLERSEVNLSSLDAVEHSLRELFSQLEQTRYATIDAAENAARTAARDTLRAAMESPAVAGVPDPRGGVADRVVQDVLDLKQQHEASERRTQAALASLNQAVARLVDQWEKPPSPEASDVLRAKLADVPLDALPVLSIADGIGAGSADNRVAAAGSIVADALIEPGEGRTAGRLQAPGIMPPGAPADGSAPFIAAARRAAQAAQASAAARQKPGQNRDRSVAVTAGPGGLSMLDRARAYLAERKRPLLLSLASLVVLLGALEVAKLELDGSSVLVSQDTAKAVPTIETPAADAPTKVAVLDTPKVVAPADPAVSSPGAEVEASLPAAAVVPVPDAAPAIAASKSASGPVSSNPFLSGVGAAGPGLGKGINALAQAGDPAAQYEVGLRYVEGRTVARDPKIAAGWFEKAATRGFAPAQYRLGSAYEKGVGEPRDPGQAVMWYGRAADAGNMRAMHNLAVMSAEGAAGKPDYVKAATLFGKAATLGVRDSQFNLAILYARGLGIEQNLAQAYTWFAIAAGQGDDDAAKKRDEVAARLDAKTLEVAKAAAGNFRPATYVKPANDVVPPAGGWDAVAAPAPSKAGASKASMM